MLFVFSPYEKVGSLYNSLKFFNEESINLSMIESRPNKKGPWKYIFFIDFEGHFSDVKVQKALEGIKSVSTEFKILGSYPTKECKK